MIVQTDASRITTGESISYWGTTFAENGLFILLETQEHENQSAATTGPELLDSLLTSYTNYQSHNLSTIANILIEVEGRQEILGLTIGIQEGKRMYLGSAGCGEALIIREGKIGTILHKGEVSSGDIRAGDILILYPAPLRMMYEGESLISLVSTTAAVSSTERIKTDLINYPEIKGVTILTVLFSSQNSGMRFFFNSPLSPLKETIKTYKEKCTQIVKHILRKSVNKDVVQERYSPDAKEVRSKRILLIVSVFLVMLLIGSIFFNINRTKDMQKQKTLADTLSLISHQFDEADSLIDLNPIRARSLLSETKLSLSPLLKQFAKNSPEYKQIQEWLGKIGEKEVIAYKIYKLTSVPVFFDVTFLKAGAVASAIASYKKTQAILDIPNKVVYILNSETKESAIIAGGDTVKDARSIAIHGNTVFILNSDGIVSVDIKSKSSKLAIKKDDKWGETVAIASYGGNVYLLDRINNMIWKYIATDFGFSNRSSYINSGVKVNFSQSKDIVIDGSVWVLFADSIAKYTQGVNDQFVISGFSDTLSGLSAFSTDETDKYLYILDQSISRIVLFDKDGVYQSQYQWDELKNATDIVASEEEKKIFISIGSKIYGIELK